MEADFYRDFVNNRWKKRVEYSYRTGNGLHRYYAIVSCEKKNIKIDFHHLKKCLVSKVCNKSFYETLDIPGVPPKKYMSEFRNKIVEECKYQFKVHQEDWDDSLIPDNLY